MTEKTSHVVRNALSVLVSVSAVWSGAGVGAIGVAGCGGNSSTLSASDAGNDATATGDAGHGSTDGGLGPGLFSGDGGCLKLGGACSTAGDCCSGDCTGGTCGYPACTSDGQGCTAGGDCCSQSCVGGKCATLNAHCSTLGNACASSASCCSGLCSGGTCQAGSFCGQPGDACSTGVDCCTGQCVVASGNALGTCATSPPAGPANCSMVDGVLCGGTGTTGVVYNDAGLPACGGSCCSRACAPYGPTGVLVCQPASGCHVVGDLCTTDGDCCGSAGLPGGSGKPVTCVITAPATLGVCRLPMGCKPDGDVCKLATMSCSSSCDCCAGNCETEDTCHQDNVGVPRCSPAQCVNAGGACASSASCCNGAPCVPGATDGGGPPFVCSAMQCVAACGGCSNSADCCPGTSCIAPTGSATGMCGPCGPTAPPADGGASPGDGGPAPSPDASSPPPTCALFGQVCTTSADCCGGVPCTGARCLPPPP
jgi:hypothetical protein